MKIVGFDGSPRDDGNTEKLVKAVLEGAAEKGAQTQYYKILKMKITPCLGCNTCREDGICTIEDEMQPLYDTIQNADALVLGSPVYMWQMTAITKGFLERLLPFLKPDFSNRLKGSKSIVLAFTQGNPNIQAFELYFDYLEKMLSMLFTVKGRIIASQTRDKNDILKNSEILEKARVMGRSLAI
jgi:multimeric flavodoxin WrbA